jgi:hypothetical protein
MTLQIAMICDEGWVLASDRLRVEAASVRVRSATEKIVIGPKLGIAYSYYGDDCAAIAGDQLMFSLPDFDPKDGEDFNRWLISLGNGTWDQLTSNKVTAGRPASYFNRGLLICLASSPAKFWHLGIGQQSNVTVVMDKLVSGDMTNGARFFIEHYYSKNTPLSGLMLLAAHTLNIAEKLNPAVVGGGIDMITCKIGKMERVSSKIMKTLIRKSDQIDQKIGGVFK